MSQQSFSISWLYSPNRGICSNMFGLITTFCIARDLNMNFYANWNLDQIKLTDKLTPQTPITQQEYIRLDDEKAMLFFENEKIEVLWKNKNIKLHSTQNLYQHFCYTRPQHHYKYNLLFILANCFKYLFIIPPQVEAKLLDIRTIPGIHVRVDNPSVSSITDVLVKCKNHIVNSNQGKQVFICSKHPITFSLAKGVFGADYTLIFNDKNVLLDLIHLIKCKTLYIAWNSNFSRMGAILLPTRDFFTYNHPDHLSNIHKCELDELLSYYVCSKTFGLTNSSK